MKNIDGAVKLSKRAVNTKFEDLSEKEVSIAKRSILDTIGVTLAGSTLGNKCHELVNYAKENGGKEESTIWGYGGKVPAMMAAFANGAVNHSLDFDECYDISGTHPSVSCLPSAIALMEKTGNLDGKELITSLTVGSDAIYRIGLGTSVNAQKAYGIFAAYAKSYFGAAVSAGKILNLTEEEMVSCFGLGYAQTCGTMQILFETDSNLREIFPAFAGIAGVLSADLAKRGVKGVKDSLEGPGGYFNSFGRGDYNPEILDVKMGDPFYNVNVTVKPYPSCRQTHMFVDATRAIMEGKKIKLDDIKKVTLKVGKFGKVLCVPEETRRNPPLPMDARFSNIYCVAAYLVNGTLGVAQFTPKSLNDPKILKVASEIAWEMDDTIDESSLVEPGGVVIEMNDGTTYKEYVTASLGSPERPMSDEDVIAKFKDCVSYSKTPLSSSAVEELIDKCMNLEKINDIRDIINLIS